MSSSSLSSSSRSYNRGQRQRSEDEKVKICECDIIARERISWTPSNPARRFWNCPNSMTRRKQCGYFKWRDEGLEPGYYKDKLLEMKQENRNLEKLVAEGKVEYKRNVARLKRVMMWTMLVSVCMLLALIWCLLKLYK